MCIICLELEKLTALEAVNNLFEMVEEIGEDHAREVMALIADREFKNLNDSNYDPLESLKALKAAMRLAPVLGEDSPEEIKEMIVAIDELQKFMEIDGFLVKDFFEGLPSV